MSEPKQSNALTLKGILSLVGAGVLALVAQLTGVVDLTGDADEDPANPTTTEASAGDAPSPKTGEASAPPKSQPKTPESPAAEPEATEPKRDDTKLIEQCFRAMRSDVQVQFDAEVVHLLPDDTRGSKHQLFLADLSNGMTLKISHNIDIAPYIKTLKKGDTVRVHGDYVYNDKGGVVHWTHRNTRGGSHPGGWIIHEGKKYE